METILRLAGTIGESIVDGPGLRYVIFTQGCPHQCPGCHNPQTHDFAGGTVIDPARILTEIAKNPLLSGVTLSGGEPFCQAGALAPLAAQLRRSGKHIMAYSGYTFEDLLALGGEALSLLRQCDLLVDGRYLEAERDLTLRFRGSRNQRVLDVQQSLAANAPVWAEGYQA